MATRRYIEKPWTCGSCGFRGNMNEMIEHIKEPCRKVWNPSLRIRYETALHLAEKALQEVVDTYFKNPGEYYHYNVCMRALEQIKDIKGEENAD